MRRIGRSSRIQIDVQPLRRTGSRRVAVSIAAVVGAARGYVLSPRRLCELPHFGEADTAFCRIRRMLGKRASRCRRAAVIDCPISNLSRTGALANILGRDDFIGIGRRLARTINPGAESSGDNAIHPSKDVRLLFGQHAPSLLLVEEDDRSAGEALVPCRSCRHPSIHLS